MKGRALLFKYNPLRLQKQPSYKPKGKAESPKGTEMDKVRLSRVVFSPPGKTLKCFECLLPLSAFQRWQPLLGGAAVPLPWK